MATTTLGLLNSVAAMRGLARKMTLRRRVPEEIDLAQAADTIQVGLEVLLAHAVEQILQHNQVLGSHDVGQNVAARRSVIHHSRSLDSLAATGSERWVSELR